MDLGPASFPVLRNQGLASRPKLSLRDPQIVNGFQTSTEIFNYFQRSAGADRTTLAHVGTVPITLA